jgi:hypothetical protein
MSAPHLNSGRDEKDQLARSNTHGDTCFSLELRENARPISELGGFFEYVWYPRPYDGPTFNGRLER